MSPFRSFMHLAIAQARCAYEMNEVPVGAVVIGANNQLLALAHNMVITRQDPTAHAEIIAIQRAAKALSTYNLSCCSIYVSLEPCAMCAQAIAHARIKRLYFGASDPKGGGVIHGPRIFSQSSCHHSPEVYGDFSADTSSDLLRKFFAQRRYKE